MRSLSLAMTGAVALAAGAYLYDEPVPTYEDVAPIFEAHCISCHSRNEALMQLRLDDYEHILKGSRKGPVVVPGDPETSELMRRIRGESEPRMPLAGTPMLSRKETARLEAWIRAGMPRARLAVADRRVP